MKQNKIIEIVINGNDENRNEESFRALTWLQIPNIKFRLMKTFMLFLAWISMGLASEILGPALPMLRLLNQLNMEQIGRCLALQGVAMIVGAALFGVLTDRFRHRGRDLILVVVFVTQLLSIIVIPYSRSLGLLSFAIFFIGFSQGGQDTVGNPSLGILWNDRATGPFNFMHSGYGLGAALAPILLRQFVVIQPNISLQLNESKTIERIQSLNSVHYPFIIISSFSVLIALVFIVYALLSNPTDEIEKYLCYRGNQICKSDKRKSLFRNLCRNRLDRYKWMMIICSFFGFMMIVGTEFLFSKFQFSYATQAELSFSNSIGYLVNSVYWISFSLSRLIVGIIAISVSPKKLILFESVGVLGFATLFAIWSNNQTVFLIFCCGFGAMLSPMFPTMLGVINMHMRISGMLVMVSILGSSAGVILTQYLAACFIHFVGFWTFPIMIVSIAALINLVTFCMLFVTRKIEVV